MFYGRARELEQLNDFVESNAGKLRIALISGPAGIGKTRLVAKAVETLNDGSRVVAATECSEFDDSFWPFADAISQIVPSEDKKGPVRRKMRQILVDAGPDILSLIPLAGGPMAAGVRVGQATGSALGNAEVGTTVRNQFVTVLTQVAAQVPLVLFIDDVQQADGGSIAVLQMLASRAPEIDMTILLTQRTLSTRAGGSDFLKIARRLDHQYLELRLGRMEPAEISEWIGNTLGDVDDAAVENVLQRTGGTPLFIDYVIRADQVDSALAVQGVELDSLVERRLDGLSREASRMLEYASVQGLVFQPSLVAAMMEIPSLALSPLLKEAVDNGLIDERVGSSPGIEPRFAFQHALVHEVVYGRGTQWDRRLLHGRAAELMADDATYLSAPTTVASHLERAGELEEAARMYVEGGHRALALSELDDAKRLLDRADALDQLDGDVSRTLLGSGICVARGDFTLALAMLEPLDPAEAALDHEARMDIALTRAKAMLGLRRIAEAVEALESAVTLSADSPDEVAARVRILSTLAGQNWFIGSRRAIEYLDEAVQLAPADPELQVSLHIRRVFALLNSGADMEDAERASELAIAKAAEGGSQLQVSGAYRAYARMLIEKYGGLRVEEATESACKALEAAERCGQAGTIKLALDSVARRNKGWNPQAVDDAVQRIVQLVETTELEYSSDDLTILLTTAVAKCEWEEAESASRAKATAAKLAPRLEGYHHLTLGWLREAQGRLSEALSCYEAAVSAFEGSGWEAMGISAEAYLANVLCRTGQAHRGRTVLDEIARRETKRRRPFATQRIRLGQARLAALEGDADTAISSLKGLLADPALLRLSGCFPVQADVELDLGWLLVDPDPAEALSLAHSAHDHIVSIGFRTWEGDAGLLLAAAHRANGNVSEADDWQARAADVNATLGTPIRPRPWLDA